MESQATQLRAGAGQARNNVAQGVDRTTHVREALIVLAQERARLLATSDVLCKRLGSVLRDEDSEGQAKAPRPIRVGLANEILAEAEELAALSIALGSVLDRLEL